MFTIDDSLFVLPGVIFVYTELDPVFVGVGVTKIRKFLDG